MAYIKSHAGGGEGCVFCEAPRQGDEEALILKRGRLAYVIMNRYPYNTGHLMVVPYRHVPSLEDLTREETLEVMELVKESMKALRKAMNPHGFNVGVNVGEAAGAGIAGHVHVHIVPRWRGDTNFVTLIAGDKVVPESLDDTYRRLKPLMRGGSGDD